MHTSHPLSVTEMFVQSNFRPALRFVLMRVFVFEAHMHRAFPWNQGVFVTFSIMKNDLPPWHTGVAVIIISR